MFIENLRPETAAQGLAVKTLAEIIAKSNAGEMRARLNVIKAMNNEG